jgi:hypothetical protein
MSEFDALRLRAKEIGVVLVESNEFDRVFYFAEKWGHIKRLGSLADVEQWLTHIWGSPSAVVGCVEWLFVGGPQDGLTHWVGQGDRAAFGGVVYKGLNVHEFGRLYRVGFLDPNDLVPSRVRELIRKTGVKHISAL